MSVSVSVNRSGMSRSCGRRAVMMGRVRVQIECLVPAFVKMKTLSVGAVRSVVVVSMSACRAQNGHQNQAAKTKPQKKRVGFHASAPQGAMAIKTEEATPFWERRRGVINGDFTSTNSKFQYVWQP